MNTPTDTFAPASPSESGQFNFALQHRTRSDHEGQAIASFCILHGHKFRVVKNGTEILAHEIPVGDVPFVHEALGCIVKPNYYPVFLGQFLHRRIWIAESWPYHERCFVKPADRHKRFGGFIKRVGWKGRKDGPFYCSSTVDFLSEWRWYVYRGQIIDARWGSGIEDPVPELPIEFPPDFSAAVDFGRLSTGELALVESNSPFACGWYGPLSESSTYAKWLAACWLDLRAAYHFPEAAEARDARRLGGTTGFHQGRTAGDNFPEPHAHPSDQPSLPAASSTEAV